jgi:PPP family 3-phenylpropionic acid transporter
MKDSSSAALRYTGLYGITQFFFWFAYGATVNFASVYLLACGLSNTAIGLITAAASGLSVLAQTLLASYADRADSLSVKTLVLGMAGGLMLVGTGLVFAFGGSPAANGLLLGLGILTVNVALPFVNALATESVNAGKPLNFSLARGFGSVGYAVMSLTLGYLIAGLGEGVTPWSIVIVSGCLLGSAALFPFEKRNRGAGGRGKTARGGVAGFFRRYPVFGVTLAGCVLIYISHVIINNFTFQIVVPRGGTSEHMGTALALAGLLEVFTMFGFPYLLRWKDSGFWFRVSGVFFTLKALGTLLAPNMGVFYLVQVFQPLGWGLMTVASVYYVNSLMREQDQIKGQAYMTMSLSVATIIGSLGGGWMIDTIGVNGMLIVAVVCGALGTAIVMGTYAKFSIQISIEKGRGQ